MSGYYPDGVSVSDIPGWDTETKTLAVHCAGSAPMLPATKVRDAVHEFYVDVSDIVVDDEVHRLEAAKRRLDQALADWAVPVDETDPEEECGFEETTDVEVDRYGVGEWECPKCGHTNEIDLRVGEE